MRVSGLRKLIRRPGRLHRGRHRGRHRLDRPAAPSRWQLAGSVAAVVTLAALAAAPVDRVAPGGYDASGTPEAQAADPFIEDEVLAEFVAPEQLEAVPVGPGRVAKPVQMVLSGAPVISTLGESGIPDVALRAYKQAEARLAVSDPGCGVPWTLLAAIGRVESNHGRFGGAQLRDDGSATRRIRGIPLDGRPNVALIRDSDGGALDGDTVYDRAVGPMQFIPSTWRAVNADGNGDGVGDPNNMFDAAQGAAQYLCTGTSDLRDPARAAQAVRRYNNADSYVRVVLGLARMYATGRVVGLPSTGDLLPDEPVDLPAVRPWPAEPPPDGTVLAKPAPDQRTEPAAPPRVVTRPRTTASEPPAARPPQPRPTTNPEPADPEPTQPQPSKPVPTRSSGPEPTQPSEPEPTQPSKPEPTRPSEPAPSEPKATEPQPTQPSEPEPTQPSEPTPSDPEPSESGKPTPAPSADPTPAQPDTAAVGWAPAMREVVGRALTRPACPDTPTPRQEQPSETCPSDSAESSRARDDKNRGRCTPQNVCKVPGSPRPSVTPGR